MFGRFYRSWRRNITSFMCKELGHNYEPLCKKIASDMLWCARCWNVTTIEPVEEREEEC